MDKHFDSRLRNLKAIISSYLQSSNNQLDLWIGDFFRKNKKYGSKDRRFYRDTLFGLLRSHGIILFMIDPVLARATFKKIENPDLLKDHLKQIDLKSFVEHLIKLKDELGSILKKLDLTSTVDVAIASSSDLTHASRLIDRLKKSYSGKEIEYLSLLHSQPKAWIRINDKKRISSLKQEAESENIKLDSIDDIYYVSQSPKIKNFKSFRAGVFDFQDIASQKLIKGIPISIKPKYIWDACAGAGGKTLALAINYPKAHIYSSDVRTHKIQELKNRAKSQRITNIKTFTHDATQEISVDIVKNYSIPKFDIILIDAPCSSSGVLRRSPDTKFRISQKSLEELKILQTSILANAIDYLSSNGCIIYSTCSIYESENELIVKDFVDQNPQMSIHEMKMEGSPEWDSDSMFKAILIKK
jgi:16S rRNA (cytosine967-C5)-methyltransferase